MTSLHGKSIDHCGKAVGRQRHRQGARRFQESTTDYFESDRLRPFVGGRPFARASCRRKASRSSAANGRLPICRSFRRTSICSRSRKTRARLKVLMKLIKRKDVDRLINACDAGREGELIFRYIVQYAKAKQPIQRLWLQSMTPAAIREGFARLARRTKPCCRWPTRRSAGRNPTGWWASTARAR